MDLSWEKIDISFFFKARIQPLEIPKVVGCQFGAIRLIRRIFGKANSWNRETCNLKTHHSTRGFFFHHFFILFIVAWVFVFSTKCPSLTQLFKEKTGCQRYFREKIFNLQKSRSSSGWISHHSSPFIPIPRSRKFHAKNIALPRRSGYYRTSDERNMTEVARSCSDREIAIQETHGPSICAHNPHHNDFPYMSSVQMWKKKSHLRLADSLSPPYTFWGQSHFFSHTFNQLIPSFFWHVL